MLASSMVAVSITGQYATENYAGDPREYRNSFSDRISAPYKSKIDQVAQEYPSDAYTITYESDSNNRLLVKVSFTTSAPVGEYDIKVKVEIPSAGGGRGSGTSSSAVSAESSSKIVVLFNPYDSNDSVYTTAANRKEYIENTDGLVWQGLSDNNNGFMWKVRASSSLLRASTFSLTPYSRHLSQFEQWKFENLQVAYDRLFRMPVADRADPVLVSRHLTYSIGADVCAAPTRR